MKYCENCGTVLEKEDKFCGSCGYKDDISKEELNSLEEFDRSLPGDQTLPMAPVNPTVESYEEKSQEKKHEGKTWLSNVIIIAIFGLLITVLIVTAFALVSRIGETDREDRGNISQGIEYESDEEIEETDAIEEETENEGSDVEVSETEDSELAIMEDFLGTWLWFIDEMDTGVSPEEFYLYYFGEDGTGVRGTGGLRETFSWSVTGDGILKIDVDGWFLVEEWDFLIDNYVLFIRSRQVSNMEYSYVRVATEGVDDLVGRWKWDEDETWYYIFEADGYGSRPGLVRGREHFAWLVTVDGGLAIASDGEGVEMWSYEIDDEGLTLTSRQVTGMEFSYIRGEL